MTYYGFEHQQLWFWKLRTVCQAFSEVFTQHHVLNSDVCITSFLQSDHLPGLAAWIRCHEHSIEKLRIAMGSPWVEAILALLQSPSRLKRLYLALPLLDTSLHLVSGFHSLTHIELARKSWSSHPTDKTDVQCLQALPNLTSLHLMNGPFSGVEAAAHLTALSLTGAEVECVQDCEFVSSLIQLRLDLAQLASIHANGVSACWCLQSLQCSQSRVGSSDPIQELDCRTGKHVKIPSGLAALTAVTRLSLGFNTDAPSPLVFGWLTELTALRFLEAVCLGCSASMIFPKCLGVMTNFTRLRVNWEDDEPAPCTPSCVTFAFAWSELVSLQHVWLCRIALESEDMQSLALLPNLETVWLWGVFPVNVWTNCEVASLVFQLGRTRPDVEVQLGL